MNRTVRASAIAFALIGLALASAPADAQSAANIPVNPRIKVSYDPPKNKDFIPVYNLLQQRKVLELLQRFLSPLSLPRDLAVRTAECGGRYYLPYVPGGAVTICYEYVQQIETKKPKSMGLVGVSMVSPEMATVGPFVLETLHNVALAVFDLREVPVWGRVDDAADHVSAFLMLQFGTDVAMKTILGSAYFLNVLDSDTKVTYDYLGDVRSTVRQRYYNVLCVAYGSDPVKFSMFDPNNRNLLVTDLPPSRRSSCRSIYSEIFNGFNGSIRKPYVNENLMAQVRAVDWISSK